MTKRREKVLTTGQMVQNLLEISNQTKGLALEGMNIEMAVSLRCVVSPFLLIFLSTLTTFEVSHCHISFVMLSSALTIYLLEHLTFIARYDIKCDINI